MINLKTRIKLLFKLEGVYIHVYYAIIKLTKILNCIKESFSEFYVQNYLDEVESHSSCIELLTIL